MKNTAFINTMTEIVFTASIFVFRELRKFLIELALYFCYDTTIFSVIFDTKV